MDLKGAVTVFILPRHGFKDDVFNDISRVLTNKRAGVQVATVKGEPVESKRNITVLPDKAVTQVDGNEVGAAVLIGCKEAVPALEREPVYALVENVVENSGVVGAVCATPLILAKLSLLEDREVTGHETVLDAAEEYGFTAADDSVAIDSGIVTGQDEAAERFGEEIADLLHQKQ